MAQNKLLNIIQQFSQNEFTDFLKKNGYDEFEEVLIKGEITDGKKFLDLNELQILKWRLPPATKRKLLSFLMEVKQNPEKFVENTATFTYNRRQSITGTHTSIKVKLEQVITTPKPIKKSVEVVEPVEPTLDEYLAMDKKPEVYYDASGYLIPTQSSAVPEENDYEPPPSERNITNFGSPFYNNTLLTERAPLALPRESTGGYIFGPEDLEPEDQDIPPRLFPRAQKKSKLPNSPNLKKPISMPVVVQNVEEEVTYYDVADYDQDTDFRRSSSELTISDIQSIASDMESAGMQSIASDMQSVGSDMHSIGSDTGTISRFFSFLRKGKKVDMISDQNTKMKTSFSEQNITNNLEPKRDKSPIYQRQYSQKNRPLPPLPPRQQISATLTFKPAFNDPTRKYENTKIDTLRVIPESTNQRPNISFNNKNVKSKSENDLVKNPHEEYHNYGNIDIEEPLKPAFPESYEKHFVPEKTAKRPLPLPPNILPNIQLDPKLLYCEDSTIRDDESEDYGSVIFNPNNEPFFRYTDRKGARLLLSDLEDGAFLFRPSKRFFLTLSLTYNNRCFNLGVQKTENNKIRLSTDDRSMSPEFATISDLISYFTRERLTFEHQGTVIETYLKTILPRDRF